MVLMSVKRLLQAVEPATLNTRSPNFSDVRGTSRAFLSADRRLECVVVTGCMGIQLYSRNHEISKTIHFRSRNPGLLNSGIFCD